MPIDYIIDKKRQVIFARGWGTLTDQELLDYQQRLRVDPEYSLTHAEVLDLTQVEQAEVTSEGVQTLADDSEWIVGAKVAVIAPANVPFGMSRMYEMVLKDEGLDYRVFRTKIEALNWLGLEGDDIDTIQD